MASSEVDLVKEESDFRLAEESFDSSWIFIIAQVKVPIPRNSNPKDRTVINENLMLNDFILFNTFPITPTYRSN